MKKIARLGIVMALASLMGGLSILRGAELPPLPPGPWLDNGGDFSAWQITYSYPSDNIKPPAGGAAPTPTPPPNGFLALPIRTVTITRVKETYHVEMIQVDREKFDKWFDGTASYYRRPGSDQPYILQPNNRIAFPDLGSSGFPDMQWIAKDNYMGMQSVGGSSCLVFSKGDMTVWIGVQSRFPVQWRRGGETRTFKQLPAPTELVLPPDVGALAAALKHDLNGWKQSAARANQ